MHPSRIALFILLLCLVLSAWGCSTSDQQDPRKGPPPEYNRFSYEVVADGLDEPMQLDFDKQGYIYWIERTGSVKRVDPNGRQINTLAEIPIYEGRAPGLIGILLDQEFEESQQIYLYYAPAEDEGEAMRLSRFTMSDDAQIEVGSEKIILTVPWGQPDGEHMGGGMVWDRNGYLLLSIGDGTAPSEFEPIHINEGGEIQDAARTAGNTDDLRGSIIRIDPQPDGSYAIPEDNLFGEGTPATRPEIYIMGTRNPWRLSVDSETGYLHWGDVGPDAGADSETYGPRGVDEFNVAREAGNFGWPFVYGGRPYPKYDYEAGEYGEPQDVEAPVNKSPNNTGLRELPAVASTLIAYPYGVAEDWPILGSGARSAVGGPVFRSEDFEADAPRVFPDYFEGKWLVTDYVRNWIMVVTINEDRTQVQSIERLLPQTQLEHSAPLDMDFGPTGDLYLAEYGVGSQGRISRIEYNAGNRAPIARASADRKAGALPFDVQLSSEGTNDHDYGTHELEYDWSVRPVSGSEPTLSFSEPSPAFRLDTAGRFEVVLTVTDPEGATGSDSFELVSGNEMPEVSLSITGGNRSFYFPGQEITYEVRVEDLEDGSIERGEISEDEVRFTAEYVPTGLTRSQLSSLQNMEVVTPTTSLRHLAAEQLITEYNCQTCHEIEADAIGPSFQDIVDAYERDPAADDQLAASITEGSVGEWGDTPMPPQPTISDSDLQQIVSYILSLNDEAAQPTELPLTGTYATEGFGDNVQSDPVGNFFDLPYERGAHVLHVSYTDRGGAGRDDLQLTNEEITVLQYPILEPETADIFSEEGITFTPSTDDPGFFISGPEAYIGFEEIDLTGINQINIGALTRFWHWSHFVGADIELRIDNPDGRLIAEPTKQVRPDSLTADDGPFFGEALDQPVRVDASELTGYHDIYIVIRNSDATEDDALVVLTAIEFEQ